MGQKELFGFLELDTVEKDGVKVTGVRDTRTNEIVKTAIGLPEHVSNAISITGSIRDLFTSFGGQISRDRKTSYNWTELFKTNPWENLPTQKIKDIDRQLEIHTGSPFSNMSQTLFTSSIEPENIDVSISTIERNEKLSPAITINSSKSRWLHEWTFSYYLETLPQRFDKIETLDVLYAAELTVGIFNFLNQVSKKISHIRILTDFYARGWIPSLDNVEVVPLPNLSQPSHNIIKLVIVDNLELHSQKLLENHTGDYVDVYSSHPSCIKEVKQVFNDLWHY